MASSIAIHGVVSGQPGVDGVLEDAPQVVAQVACDLGRPRLNLFQRSGQFEARDLRDPAVLEAGRQVLLVFPVALQDHRWPKVCARRGTPVGTPRAEAALDAVQFCLGAALAFIASRLDGANALGDQLARLRVGVPRVGERGLGERPKRLQTFDADQPELAAPEFRAFGLDEDGQATRVGQLAGTSRPLGRLDLKGRQHRGYRSIRIPSHTPSRSGSQEFGRNGVRQDVSPSRCRVGCTQDNRGLRKSPATPMHSSGREFHPGRLR